MSRKGPPRLYRSIYLHGVVLLLAVGVTTVVVGAALGRALLWREYPERLARHLADQLGPLRDRPEALGRGMKRIAETLRVQTTIYGPDGALEASSGDPPLGPLDPGDAQRLESGPLTLRERRARSLVVAVPLKGGGYLEMSFPSLAVRLLVRGVIALVAILLALALTSFPLARAIARPLERLSETARRLGAGDLSVRSGIQRDDEIGGLAVAFDDMADRLQRLVQGERDLLANVSHELRTPLSRIRVALDLAAEGDPEGARRYLREIRSDLAELEQLVDDILTTARLEAGPGGGLPPLRATLLEPGRLLEETAARFRGARPGRPLGVSVEPGLPSLLGDRALLRRVLDNLLDNAAKYSDDGTPIELSAAKDSQGVALAVQDHGIGVDSADIPRLFTPFFRTDRSRARQTGGVGLGLALAKRLVEAHGGEISLESVPGQGTVVRVILPVAPA